MGSLSFSLTKLRQLGAGFEALHGGRPVQASAERSARRLARELGATALPLLLRELGSDDDGRRRWAHTLLAEQAGEPALRDRVVAGLHAMVGRAAVADRVKLRAVALLAELGVRPPEAALRDPDGARRRSLSELAACLTSPGEVARATAHLLDELDGDDLEGFVADLARAEPEPAGLLLDELLVRDDLPDGARRGLRDLRATVRAEVRAIATRPTSARRPPIATLGRHADGRRILVLAGRAPGRPPRLRVLCALLATDGRLLDAHAADELATTALERAVLDPLTAQGFAFAAVGLDAARGCLIQAARSTINAGVALPRDFYLGRDLIGLRDEHLDGTHLRDADGELAAQVERAGDLLRAGEHAAARALLLRYVADRPDDPDGHAQLGLCALGLGDATAAGRHLSRAAFLGPDEALHQWNLAAAAFRADDHAACHQALRGYLAMRDSAPDAAGRRSHAERFVAEFERLRDLRQPRDVAPPPRPRARRAPRR